jgi:hypothetical protein
MRRILGTHCECSNGASFLGPDSDPKTSDPVSVIMLPTTMFHSITTNTHPTKSTLSTSGGFSLTTHKHPQPSTSSRTRLRALMHARAQALYYRRPSRSADLNDGVAKQKLLIRSCTHGHLRVTPRCPARMMAPFTLLHSLLARNHYGTPRAGCVCPRARFFLLQTLVTWSADTGSRRTTSAKDLFEGCALV